MTIESGNETTAALTHTGRATPFVTDQLVENKSVRAEEERVTSRSGGVGGGGGLYRNKCVSFLALVAGLAAFGSSLAALAGTTSWVDTWESIDLPPSQDWPALFGTGYGSLMPTRSIGSNSNGKDKSSQTSKSASASTSGNKLATLAGIANGMDQPTKGHVEQTESLTMPPMTTSTTTIVRPSVFGHLPWPATTTRQHLPITTPVTPSISGTKESEKNAKDEDDDEFDYEDEYYAHDQGVDEQIIRVVNADNDQGDDKDDVLRHDHDDQEQQDEEPRRSLVVVFHVGLFRACPVLKGELPSSVGKCLLLPLYFSFFVFRLDANAIRIQLSFFIYLFDERVLIASTRSRVESVKFTLSDAYHFEPRRNVRSECFVFIFSNISLLYVRDCISDAVQIKNKRSERSERRSYKYSIYLSTQQHTKESYRKDRYTHSKVNFLLPRM